MPTHPIDQLRVSSIGRQVHGPTPPACAIPCARKAPLEPAEIAEVVATVAAGRRERRSVSLPERLWTRDWDSILKVVEALDMELGLEQAGWKIGAASSEIRAAEGVPEPSPGFLYRDRVLRSPASLPADFFINFRNTECEFAFRLSESLPPRDFAYSEQEVAECIECVIPVLEIGDTVFDDWYGASAFLGACLDNGGGAAIVLGEPERNWSALDLPGVRIDVSFNGRLIKHGFGRAAMGHPLTSLTWLINWLRRRGQAAAAGALISTGTCTGHCFAAPGDTVSASFGPLGVVTAVYEPA